MTHHVHFDEAKIEAKNAEMRAIYATMIDKPGVHGVEARLKDALMPVFTLAMVREINRGSDIRDLSVGMASVLAHMALTFIVSATGGTHGSQESRMMLASALTLQMSQLIAHGLDLGNDGIATHVSAENGGRA